MQKDYGENLEKLRHITFSRGGTIDYHYYYGTKGVFKYEENEKYNFFYKFQINREHLVIR